MMHDVPEKRLWPREARALERNEAERAMRDWLRAQAADRRPDGIHGGPFWFVIRVRHGDEWSTAARLRQWGIRSWCPRAKRVNKGPRGKKSRYWREVLIPGYLLVELAPSQAAFDGVLTFVKQVFGFIGREGVPYTVHPKQIKALRELVAERPTKADGGDAWFSVGQLVMLTGTAFAGFEGFVEREENLQGRLKVTVSVHGRPMLCDVGVDQVDKL